MKNLKFGAFSLGLLVAIGSAVSILAAQDREVRPGIGRGLMMLDGRGSQLGLVVSDLDAREQPAAGGVRIDEVSQDSPAEKAGLKAGDVVVEYDGERVRSARQFTRLIQETPEGRSVRIAVLRNGQKQSVEATPEARAFSWNMDWDADQIRRDYERELQRYRVEPPLFRFDPDGRGFDFRFDEMLPRSSRGRLGVNVQELSTDLAAYFGVKDGGVLVSSVTSGSAAEKAGVKAGDVIVSVNGDRVDDASSLVAELDSVSGEITLGVVRDKKEITLKATIEPRSTTPRAGSRRGLHL